MLHPDGGGDLFLLVSVNREASHRLQREVRRRKVIREMLLKPSMS